MRVLILGASGMLGHKLCQMYRDRFDTWATVRSKSVDYSRYNLLKPEQLIGDVDAFNLDKVADVISKIQPYVVINCIGIVKQSPLASDPITCLTVNSLFPHHLAQLCTTWQAKLIHISTDCVFSGRKGMYVVDDISDAEDLYGRSKYLGEVNRSPHLTLRTSIVGRELHNFTGLIEWFLSNRGGKVYGFSRAIYSGLTTIAFVQVIEKLIDNHFQLSGVYHISTAPISKYNLLCLLRDSLDVDITIEPCDYPQIDRSLDSGQFWHTTDMMHPSWPDMISAMANDPTPYDTWRSASYDA